MATLLIENLDSSEFLVSDLNSDELTQVVGGGTILGGGQIGPGSYHYTVSSGGQIFAAQVYVSPFDGSKVVYVTGIDSEGIYFFD